MLFDKKIFYFLLIPLVVIIQKIFHINSLKEIDASLTLQILFMIIIYYIIGMLLIRLGKKSSRINSLKSAFVIFSLVLIDQFSKVSLFNILKENHEIIIWKDIIHLVHFKNLFNSYFLSEINLEIDVMIIIIFKLIVFLGFIVSYIYIKKNKRENYWIEMMYVFWGAGIICSLLDSWLWGYSYDFVRLPGLYKLDFKDIYIDFGLGMTLLFLGLKDKKFFSVNINAS